MVEKCWHARTPNAFNNRRMTRGALLYDLLMALRFERKEARLLGVWQALCRLASDFREEDKRERDSRRSWRRAKTVLGERPHLRATTFKVRAGK
ncbi:MAG: transcriptional regulator [Methylobacterium sp.]|nr:transcriptional regulator [Methylobacterium sp.]